MVLRYTQESLRSLRLTQQGAETNIQSSTQETVLTIQINRRTLLAGAAASWLMPAARIAFADTYPSHQIRLITPNSAGSSVDILARRIAGSLGKDFGQTLYVDNLPGAGGIIGTETLIRAAPDGYTLAVVASNHVVLPHVNPKVRYDAIKQITPVAMILEGPLILAARPGFLAKNAAELIAWCKANPGKLNFGTSGVGTTVDLAGRALQQAGGIEVANVAYRGVSALVPDLISGQVDVGVFGVTAIAPQIKSGAVRGLGITSQKRIAALPDVPPISDSVKGFDFPAWYALIGPAGMPPAITDQLAKAVAKLQADPAFIETVGKDGDSPRVMGPADLSRFMASESARFAKLVKDANIVIE
jgi:tripartite-type tricarboxylate transporter receptor subunit TctC